MVSSSTPFHHSTPESEAPCHSSQMALIHPLTHQASLRESITTDITRDQMLLREEWMRRFMVSSPTLFHHSMSGSTARFHSFQMVLTHPLMRVPLSLREDITVNITLEMLPREAWTRKSTVSSPTPFHHSTPESE